MRGIQPAEVWRAAEGRGSVFHSGDMRTVLAWSADDRLVFPWERDGWLHLYSIPSAGGTPILLTPGEFEVDGITYTADGRAAIISSNQNDIDRRHLWRISTAAATPAEALTPGTDLEWFPAVMADGVSFAFVRGDDRRPGLPALRIAAAPVRELLPAALPQIITGLRIALGVAWLVVVAAEMIATDPEIGGLGYLINDARNAGSRYDLVVAGMALIGLIGLPLDLLIRRLEQFDSVRWGYGR